MRRVQIVGLVLAVMLAITALDAVLLVATGRAATTTTTTTTSTSTTIDYQISHGVCVSCYYAPDPSSRTYNKVPAGAAGAVPGSSLANVGKQNSILTNPVSAATGLVSSGVSGLVGGVAGDVMDQVTNWVVNGAKSVLGFVEKAATATTTPELRSGWFSDEFNWIVVYASGIAAIVALAGIISASIRHDPGALGHVLFGIGRAGLLTGMVVALTLLALAVVDGISADIVQAMPAMFFATLSGAWGTSGFGGLASSALAFLAALLEMGVALLLWVELIFRDAAIYLAVLFFPVTLAIAIWPRLGGAQAKLIRILATFIIFKPVALFTLMTGANILLGGVSIAGGVAPSVGAILSGLVVLALAAFAPWTLMHLLSTEVGSLSPRQSSSRSASKSESNTIIGGDLNAGSVTAAGGASPAGGGGQSAGISGGGSAANSAPPSSNGSGSGPLSGASSAGTTLAPLTGAVAAAAGWVPAVAAAGAQLAHHGAARIHTAAGAGGSAPGDAPWAGFRSSSTSAQQVTTSATSGGSPGASSPPSGGSPAAGSTTGGDPGTPSPPQATSQPTPSPPQQADVHTVSRDVFGANEGDGNAKTV